MEAAIAVPLRGQRVLPVRHRNVPVRDCALRVLLQNRLEATDGVFGLEAVQ
jgi:hypothetical protein